MVKAYWIAIYKSITDPARHAEYAKIAAPAIAEAGGQFLVRSGEFTSLWPTVLSGRGLPQRDVVPGRWTTRTPRMR